MTSARGADKYPLARAALERMGAAVSSSSPAPAAAPLGVEFTLGPAVLRAPPEIKRSAAAAAEAPDAFEAQEPKQDTDEMLGELVDMVFVSAEESATGGHEVHLVFKAEVLGGLHMKLKKTAEGMHATFVVEDAAARRAVVDHIDGLVAHLKERGFSIVGHTLEIAK